MSTYFELELQNVINFVLDSEQQLSLLESLVSKGGRRTIMFYYQMSEVPKGESGRTFPKTESGEVMKVIVSDGMGAPLTDQCVFFSKKSVIR